MHWLWIISIDLKIAPVLLQKFGKTDRCTRFANGISLFARLSSKSPSVLRQFYWISTRVLFFQSLDNDFKRNASSLAASDGMPIIGAYHYGSHYSNSGVVVHYLVRLPPFTQLVLEYQGEFKPFLSMAMVSFHLWCFIFDYRQQLRFTWSNFPFDFDGLSIIHVRIDHGFQRADSGILLPGRIFDESRR